MSAANEEKISPFNDAYSAPDPELYMKVGQLGYRPEVPVVPEYTKTLLDCACLFGNTSLACMYGWDFPKACEFWIAGKPLSDDDREKTLIGRRFKIIGLDLMPRALEYSKKMNIIDEMIIQNFAHDMSDSTRQALTEADMITIQQCISHMPLENLKQWMAVFLKDRKRPKRFVYDYNPYFDSRNMNPKNIFENVEKFEFTEKFFKYRNKTDEEYKNSQENGRDMCVYHYVVDFLPMTEP